MAKEYNRLERRFRVWLIVAGVVCIGWLALFVYSLNRTVAEVEQRGLKNVLGDVWNGSGKP